MATNTFGDDTFASFVEAVAHNLGDRSVSSDGFAAQAFLSRPQFDRVIRASAGEPPASFQRRVMLERAAYQLATSKTGILEIALEAGYSSHEAFVRAFRRAYGVNPSDWRASPRQIKLPTPSDVHFRPPETVVDAHCTPVEIFTYGGLIAHVLTFAAHRRTLVLGALASAGITDLGSGDPRKWVAEAA